MLNPSQELRHATVFFTLFFTLLSFIPCQSQENPSLIDVKKLAPGIVVEMRYATTNNFTKKKLYPVADECLLCEPAAQRLAHVQKNLEKRGLGLKVWDCYRPISVQRKLWEIVPDDRYVANPEKGSRHNRGASVDLTLVDSKGRELEMPTGFDEFSERAHRNFMDLSKEALKNRALLQEAMEAEGFLPLPTEWWHFDAPEWSHYALRDEPLGSASLKEDKIVSADLLSKASQALVVTSDNWTAKEGTLQRYEKVNGTWVRVGTPWPVSLGQKGMAWGKGSEESAGTPQKTEGDNKSPAGIFKIGRGYGYADKVPANSRWPYQQVNEQWRCVDDPNSKHYNEIFEMAPGLPKDWKSAELMKRKDHLYKWVINIEQNTPATGGCGSCIFLHIWRKPASPTEGCTAMAEEHMMELFGWLNPLANSIIIQLPKPELLSNVRLADLR